MGTFLGIALIVFLTIPLPILIVLYFISQWKQSREMSSADEQMLQDLWTSSQRLEERLEALEIILDNDAPEWRRKQ